MDDEAGALGNETKTAAQEIIIIIIIITGCCIYIAQHVLKARGALQ